MKLGAGGTLVEDRFDAPDDGVPVRLAVARERQQWLDPIAEAIVRCKAGDQLLPEAMPSELVRGGTSSSPHQDQHAFIAGVCVDWACRP